MENNVNPKCNKWELKAGVCKRVEIWNDHVRKNIKESKMLAFICKKPKVSGKFHKEIVY